MDAFNTPTLIVVLYLSVRELFWFGYCIWVVHTCKKHAPEIIKATARRSVLLRMAIPPSKGG